MYIFANTDLYGGCRCWGGSDSGGWGGVIKRVLRFSKNGHIAARLDIFFMSIANGDPLTKSSEMRSSILKNCRLWPRGKVNMFFKYLQLSSFYTSKNNPQKENSILPFNKSKKAPNTSF